MELELAVRVVQLTPPGSACSIGMGTGPAAYDQTPPGSVGGRPRVHPL
ncbi:hypothetical protein ACI78Q_20970 [Geodermatophilus sp. SYSU D00705]